MIQVSLNRTISNNLSRGVRKPSLRFFSSKNNNGAVTSSSVIKNNTANSPNNIKYAIAGGFILTIAGGIKYVNDEVGGLEGLQRTLSFYSLAVPAYGKYRMHMMLESPDETWDELDRDTSQRGLEKILELRGFYIKR